MLYNLDHAEDIDRCVRVSSTIRILPDMRVRIFSGGERLPDKGTMGILTYMWYIEILESTGQCHLSLFQ